MDKENKTTERSEFDWINIFNRTFLSIYLEASHLNPSDPLVGAGKYDYLFNINGHLLYVLVQHEDLQVSQLRVAEAVLNKFKQRAAAKLTKRFQKLRYTLPLPSLATQTVVNTGTREDQRLPRPVHSVHCIGLTALTVWHDNKSYPIAHEYGGCFFQEDCVLDLDGDEPVMHLFSLGGFLDVLKRVQTSSDLLGFLTYHLPILVNQDDYPNETVLVERFLASPQFFSRAIQVQKRLVEIGLLAEVEKRLLEASTVDTGSNTADLNAIENGMAQNNGTQSAKTAAQNRSKLLKNMQSYSRMYQKLLNGATRRHSDAQALIPLPQVRLLVEESMYTRMSIMEELIAYANHSNLERRQGYLSHQHSYNAFGRHYVLIVYGTDKSAEYSRAAIQANYASILLDINSQLQNPVMTDYFILGFDMSKRDGKGDVVVEMDIFYQQGALMSMLEKQLYQQVQELNGH